MSAEKYPAMSKMVDFFQNLLAQPADEFRCEKIRSLRSALQQHIKELGGTDQGRSIQLFFEVIGVRSISYLNQLTISRIMFIFPSGRFR